MTIPFSHYAPDPHVSLLFQCFSTKKNKYKILQGSHIKIIHELPQNTLIRRAKIKPETVKRLIRA